ncbi:hypothetical protein [Paracidovorax anthurii]|uniref:Uncharacterized protein n=1 Tax=Paracidovorax anthurii TaxID=78229 RepID=A0A328Z6C9_9BURK|nr:hypothetical protein [Paracidovorax anthurii]RAR77806.1 hypothetical protein AX018_10349 [Paracidovorax anthurii]
MSTLSVLSVAGAARAGLGGRIRSALWEAAWRRRVSRLPLGPASALRPLSRRRAGAVPPGRTGASLRHDGAHAPGVQDGAPPSPAQRLLERFQLCEIDAMQRSQMRQVVEFLGGRGKALRTAPLQANWKALRAAFAEEELREVIVERTAAIVGILLRAEPVGGPRVSILGLPRDEALEALRRGGMTEADISELRRDIFEQLRRGGSTSGEWLRAKYEAFVSDDFTRSGVYVSYVRLFSPASEADAMATVAGEA